MVNSQRDRLLDSMAEACAGKRYAEVSVADVVDRAKVSRSTFYEIFPDKEACFLATYDAILGRFVAEVIRAARGPDLDWPDQIEAGVETCLAFFADEPAFARMCIIDMFSAGDSALARYRSAVRMLSAFVDRGRKIVDDGGEVPASVAGMLVGGAAVVIRAGIVEDRTERLPEVGPDLVYSILVSYMDRDEALTRSERYAERVLAEHPG